jgi:hypothetical protein
MNIALEIDTVIELAKLVFTGLIGGYIAHFFTVLKVQKEQEYEFLGKLYEKRWETYAKLLAITQDIGKSQNDVAVCIKAREDLKEWQKTTGGSLLFSETSRDEFNKLKDVLKKNPEAVDKYSAKQREKIFHARNALRGALWDDFKLFRNAEQKLE